MSAPRPQRRAVIDIGTNSVKLLVGDVRDGVVQPVFEGGQQTRLGQGFYDTRELRPDAIARTAAVVRGFADQARSLGAARPRVIATSATREARNQQELLEAVQLAAGLAVEIISGETEAEWVFQGVVTDPALAGAPLLILDVGGGSTEFIVVTAGEMRFRHSFQLGTVRLLEAFPPADPPRVGDLTATRGWLQNLLHLTVRPFVLPHFAAVPAGSVRLVGTGGAALILARIQAGLPAFDRERMEGARLAAGEVAAVRDRLWRLPLSERRQVAGLPPERADVMLMGAAIFAEVLSSLGLPQLQVSTRGLRHAALLNSPAGDAPESLLASPADGH